MNENNGKRKILSFFNKTKFELFPSNKDISDAQISMISDNSFETYGHSLKMHILDFYQKELNKLDNLFSL